MPPAAAPGNDEDMAAYHAGRSTKSGYRHAFRAQVGLWRRAVRRNAVPVPVFRTHPRLRRAWHEIFGAVVHAAWRHPETMKMAAERRPPALPIAPPPTGGQSRNGTTTTCGSPPAPIFEPAVHAALRHPETMKIAVLPTACGPLRRRAWRPVGTNDAQIFGAATRSDGLYRHPRNRTGGRIRQIFGAVYATPERGLTRKLRFGGTGRSRALLSLLRCLESAARG